MTLRLNGSTSGYVEIDAPAVAGTRSIVLPDELDSKLPISGGKILQIVRATDTTQRTTTSNDFVDASISVTITPQKSNSSILLIWCAAIRIEGGTGGAYDMGYFQITDSSNNAVSGAQSTAIGNAFTGGSYHSMVLIGYATPGTTSSVTYKGRFRDISATTAYLVNESSGQLFAIEVSA
jgi:hypothetical protein